MSTPQRCYVNLGLKSKTLFGGKIPVQFALGVMIGLGMNPTGEEVHYSHTEDTLIAVVDFKGILFKSDKLCHHLQQDCVAIHVPGHPKMDMLCGPMAVKWGDFDAMKFIMPGGKTLGEILLAA